jgi:cytochrome c-type biogenesis protein CcsB
LKYILSMKSMGLLTLIFAIAIAVATFIENDYGTIGAKSVVYNATWFNILLVVLAINLVSNIQRYKLYKKEKLPLFIFHISFVLILIGAGVTRFIGFEGVMGIKENQTTNSMLSADTYLSFSINDGKGIYSKEDKVLFSEIANNNFSEELKVGINDIKIEYLDFITNAQEIVKEDKNGISMVELVVSANGFREDVILKPLDAKKVGNQFISFSNSKFNDIVLSYDKNSSQMYISSKKDIATMSMDSGKKDKIIANHVSNFEKRKLYTIGDMNIVLKEFYKSAKIVLEKSNIKNSQLNALKLKVSNNSKSQEIYIFGKEGIAMQAKRVSLDGVDISIGYGSKVLKLPFEIKLRDFRLDRYAGSMSASSYESDITLIDNRKNIKQDYTIFMNNVFYYDGYRFYQSSYEPDESGTVLSVNNDFWGMIITYLGYFLLSVGFIWSLFSKHGRVYSLSTKIEKIKEEKSKLLVAILSLFVIYSNDANANANQNSTDDKLKIIESAKNINSEHVKMFSKLLVQDRGGRVKPIDTLAREVVRKLSGKNEILGLDANSVFFSMTINPDIWQMIKMIKLTHPELKKEYGGKYIAFGDLFNIDEKTGRRFYKLQKKVEEVNRIKPALRGTYEKAIIKLDEKINICYMVYTGSLLRIFPKPHDSTNTWYAPMDAMQSWEPKDAQFVTLIFRKYFGGIDKAKNSNDWKEADDTIKLIETFQRKSGASVIPMDSKIDIELKYNEYQIFKKLIPFYFILGFILLIMVFANVLKTFNVQKYIKIFSSLIFVIFAIHTIGLMMRWYISGHAPWSDSYESMIYISWAIILSGFIFINKSYFVIPATAILSGLTLFVAHLSWLEPEITNLVPVLKSYWLVIHVAIITASYGFLALGALIGFIVLTLMIIKTDKNYKIVDLNIKELTYINEMTLIVGLIMLTIGNFLGGVWANESWGRYWGWDPKETWALISILVYTFVVHIRFMGKMYSIFVFNVLSIVAFSSIIMTYFGVNFYLSGLHSYAKGDPVPIPMFVYYTIAITFIMVVAAKIRENKFKNIDNK